MKKNATKNRLTNKPDLVEFFVISFEINQIRILEPIKNKRGNNSS